MIKKVTETRRDRDGQLATVVTETMDQQASDVVRRRVPVVNATMPHANHDFGRLAHAFGKPNRAGPVRKLNDAGYSHSLQVY